MVMKKKELFLLNGLIVVFAAIMVWGMFLDIKTGLKLYSIGWGIYIFFNLKWGLFPLSSCRLRLMWGLVTTDVVLTPLLLGEPWVLLGTAAVVLIHCYAPPMGALLHFNEVTPTRDWNGTITDEGEIIGEWRYYTRNRASGTLFVVCLAFFFFGMCYFAI